MRKARPMEKLASKREQRVTEVVYRLGQATAREIYEALPDASSYTAVRGVLTVLEEKGRLRHTRDGRRYVYRPAVSGRHTARAELLRLVRTFFGGSRAELMSALLAEEAPSADELDRLRRLIDEAQAANAKKEGE